MWLYVLVIGAVALFSLAALWCVWSVVWTASHFVRELRLARLVEQPVEIRQAATFRDAESALLAAEDGFRSVLSRTWRELIGFDDPAARQRALVNAWAELLTAQRAMRTLQARHPQLALEPGDDVPLVEDPIHALAVARAWALWFGLMLLPSPFRAIYTFVALRIKVRPLLDHVRELDGQLAEARRFEVDKAPRKPSIYTRVRRIPVAA